MKRLLYCLIIAAMLVLNGCLVSSLHPFYESEDKIFDPVMVGQWIDSDGSVWTIQETFTSYNFMGPQRSDSTYQITYYEEEHKRGYFTATLFQIKGVTYVDFYPDVDEDHCSTDLTGMHHFPTHTLARVQYNKDSILIYWFGEEWLNDLFDQNRIRIKHETVTISDDYSSHLLTAPTDELQKFIKKYANDPVTSREIELIFARGYTDDQEDYGVFLKLKPYRGTLPGESPGELNHQVQPDRE